MLHHALVFRRIFVGKEDGLGEVCISAFVIYFFHKAEVIIKWQIRKRNIHFVNLLQVCFESFYIFVLRFNLFFLKRFCLDPMTTLITTANLL